MKKNHIWYYICIALVFMGMGFYSNVVTKTFRYDTPEEAFEKTKPDNASVIEIFEESDIAMIAYREPGTVSFEVIFKDEKGWSPLTIIYDKLGTKGWGSGFANIDDVNGTPVISIAHKAKVGESVPEISDSLGTEFYICTYEQESSTILVVFGILPNELPSDYTLYIGEQEVVFE